MGLIKRHWYSENEGTLYPVDEAASGVSDDGDPLPLNLIVDLNLRWPEHLGGYAFLAAASVSGQLVSIAIQAAGDLTETPALAPLAVLGLPQPVVEGRCYALLPQAPGVGGWVVFGSGCRDRDYRGRFASPQQGLLAPRSARSYRSPPVSGLRVAGAGGVLTGRVKLIARSPLTLTREDREIEGVVRTCLVARLVNDRGGSPSVWQAFAGPCAGRPESGTCDDPEPIQTVNGVGPDCDGVLTLELTGDLHAAKLTGGGLVLNAGTGLADACLPDRLPASDGALPGEVDAAPPHGPDASEESAVSEVVPAGVDLPHLECFAGSAAADFSTPLGTWGFVNEDPGSPCFTGISYEATTAIGRSLAVWEGENVSTLGRRASAAVKLRAGPIGARHNGGLVLNYRGDGSYHVIEIDYDRQELLILRYTGSGFAGIAGVIVPGLSLDRWYRLTGTVQAGSGSAVTLTARLESIEGPALDVTLGPLSTNHYLPGDGRFGFSANRALARFGYLAIEKVD